LTSTYFESAPPDDEDDKRRYGYAHADGALRASKMNLLVSSVPCFAALPNIS
jgi:hypothetical protein